VNACDNHGTLVAGVISGIIDNGVGGVGAAPGTRIASARAHRAQTNVLPCTGLWVAESAWTVSALDWAESIGARITKNSNFWDTESSDIAQKYQATRDNGMLHFGIAGNNGDLLVGFPGKLPSVNAVTAITRTGNLWFYSNYGNEVDFTAPGVDIYTTDRTGSAGVAGGDYTFESGTSLAPPMVAGVAALLLSHAPALSPGAVEKILAQSALDLGTAGWDYLYGHGLVRAREALELLIFADGFESGDTSTWSATESQP
jgi:subtilisin family serine protease